MEKVNIQRKGTGPLIVLLHGWGQNMQMMQFIQDAFADQYTVLNLDLPGFGESEEPSTAWSCDDYAHFIHEIVQGIQKEPVILIAHSFGARIAFRYALHYPVKQMVLTGAAGIRKKRTLLYYCKVYSYKLCKKLSLPIQAGSSDYRQASSRMREIMVKAVNEDITKELANINVETLLVWGEEDNQTPLWMGKKMEQMMKNATLVVLEKDDHFAYFHQSHRFIKIIQYFLRRD